MITLDDKLTELRNKENRILGAIDERNRKRKIQCGACDDFHEIGNLKAIQTYWYVPPRGCSGGDYCREGELQFVCPETGIVNRLLFSNYDVPWEERKDFDNDLEEQFKRNYKKLFKEVIDDYDKATFGKWVNNYYVDENREKFGLVERRKRIQGN